MAFLLGGFFLLLATIVMILLLPVMVVYGSMQGDWGLFFPVFKMWFKNVLLDVILWLVSLLVD